MRPVLPLLAVVVVAACGGPEIDVADAPPETSPPPTIAEGSVTLTGGEECHNPEAGYRIRYPSGWFANEGEVGAPCRIFDDEPVLLRQQTEVPFDLGVIIGVVPGSLDEHREAGGIAATASTETTVDERQAIVLRGRGNGDALIPAATGVHRYVVQVADGQVLIASTYDTGELAFARKIEVLDAMMGTLELDA